MNFRHAMSAAATAGLTLLIAACGTITQTSKGLDAVDKQASELINVVQPQPRSSVEVVRGQVWVNRTAAVREAPIDPDLNCRISWATTAATLDRLAQRINSVCGLGVRVTADAQQSLSGQLDQQRQATPSATPGPGAAVVNPLPDGFTPPPLAGANNSLAGGGAGGYGATRTNRINITFDDGELHNLLDFALGQLSLSYSYDHDKKLITIFYLQTDTFTIKALPSDNTLSNSIEGGAQITQGTSGGSGTGSGNGNSGIGGSGTTSSSTTTKITNNVLNDLQKAMDSMCSRPGCAVVSPSTSSVTVTDTPDVVRRIGRYIDRANETMFRQVALKIEILLYTNTTNTDIGASLDAAFTAATSKFGASIATGYTPTVSGGQLTANILEGGGQWSGSKAIFNALQERGKVSTVYKTTTTALNLQPIPIQVYKNNSFVQSQQTSQAANSGTLQTIQTATVTTGFFMSILPNILDDGREVLLQFSQNISLLDKINTYSAPGSFTQGPDTQGSASTQRVHVKTGQTIVMTGFQADGLALNSQAGIGGGGKNVNNKRQTIVMMVTPVVQE